MFRPTAATMGAFRATQRVALMKPKFQPHVGNTWIPSLGFWGFTGAVFVTIAMSGVPLFKKDVLDKTPLAPYFKVRVCRIYLRWYERLGA